MNTNDYTNQLRALMDFYDTTGAGGPRSSQAGMFGGMGSNEANYAGDRLRFAQGVLGGAGGPMGRPPSGAYAAMPDYFPADAGGAPGGRPMPQPPQPQPFRVPNALFSLIRH